jgi:hypothetical protein
MTTAAKYETQDYPESGAGGYGQVQPKIAQRYQNYEFTNIVPRNDTSDMHNTLIINKRNERKANQS